MCALDCVAFHTSVPAIALLVCSFSSSAAVAAAPVALGATPPLVRVLLPTRHAHVPSNYLMLAHRYTLYPRHQMQMQGMVRTHGMHDMP